ncbi:MAG: mechanosensitive ion channel [Phycisphaerales bacterium]|nr:MAG: mechanosensitive ion channel [Phycisphaerales bacterium]
MRSLKTKARQLPLLLFTVVLLCSAVANAAQEQPPDQNQVGTTGEVSLDLKTAQEVLTRIYAYLAEYGLKIVGAIAIFIVGRWLARFFSRLAGKAMTKAKVDKTLVRFSENLFYLVLLTFVVIAAVANMGVQTTSFIAVLGAAGLAVGLALQGSLANFASGVLMLIFKPMRVGDFVEAGGAKGTVKEIGIFTTVLNSPDNIRIIVPNSQVTGSNVSNYTANGTRRVDMVVGVSYEDDLKKAQQVIENVLAEDDRILSDPAPTVAVSELGDSSVNFVVRPWTKASDYWNVRFDTTAKIKLALDESGITIPFPQRDIHIKGGALGGTTK